METWQLWNNGSQDTLACWFRTRLSKRRILLSPNLFTVTDRPFHTWRRNITSQNNIMDIIPFWTSKYAKCHLEIHISELQNKRLLNLPLTDNLFQFTRINLTDTLQDYLAGGSATHKATTCIGQHKHRINAGIVPSLEWDPNPRSHCLNGLRYFVPWTVWSPLSTVRKVILITSVTNIKSISISTHALDASRGHGY